MRQKGKLINKLKVRGLNVKQFVILYPESTAILNQFADLENLENVSLQCVRKKNIINPFLKFIRKIHLSKKINTHINLPFKNLWYSGTNFKVNKDIETYVLVVSGVLSFLDMKFFEKKNNIQLILLLFNSMEASSPTLLDVKDKIAEISWDACFTFDQYDANKYGYQYLGTSYYSKPINIKESKNHSDVYFVGGLKGRREKTIINVFKKLHKSGINCNFNLFYPNGQNINDMPYTNEINYYTNHWKPYSEIISDVKKTNCILEILQEGQNNQSLRYFEAVCFNKKLLTNNKNITKLPFYNPKYMKVFSTVEDIDLDWVTKKETIDYNYNNEFSPINLLDQIEMFFEK